MYKPTTHPRKHTRSDDVVPGLDLYHQVRGAFVAQGTSLNRWCQEQRIRRENARDSLTGSWNGPKGKALRERLVAESGLLVRAA